MPLSLASYRNCFALLAAGLSIAETLNAVTDGGPRTLFADSIKEVPPGTVISGPHIVRATLTAGELAQPIGFMISLRMRNFGELQDLVQSGRGRIVSKSEMEARYLPAKSDYNRVAAWLTAQGFTITLVDSNHTNVFARGSVAATADAFKVSFARVTTDQGEFTSAVTVPSLPYDLASPVLGFVGLQPHVRMRSVGHQSLAVTNVSGFTTPADILSGYHVPGNLTGAGQTIGIFSEAIPIASDLTAFWQATGTTRNPANYSVVEVNGGPTASSQAAGPGEATMDLEWAGAIAPGAKLILYACSGSNTDDLATAVQILNDGVAKIVSASFGSTEAEDAPSLIQSSSQILAQMAAAGITLFAGSGDGGSNPDINAPGTAPYSPSSPRAVIYPASDPSVTAVGGTTATFDSNWTMTGETSWFIPNYFSTGTGSGGGGLSTVFLRPAWQSGPGVPDGTARCVPDVAAMAFASTATGKSLFIIENGQIVTGVGGTSLASPTWAGMTALVNQARANAGLPTLGLLGPWIYPLIGTPAFTDITTGTNGAYNAGPGYDLCTGIGSPNIAALAAALGPPLAFTTQPTPQAVSAGATTTLSASATGAASYQWRLNGANIAGATNSSLTLSNLGTTQRGSYTVVASNAFSSITSNPTNVAVSGTSHLYNISSRAYISTGSFQNLVAGFYTDGPGSSKNVVLRGIGPNLAIVAPSLAGLTLANPKLTLYDARAAVLATNTAWGGGQTLANAFSSVYAASLQPNSNDTAVFMSVPAGAGVGYTAEVDGLNNGSGVALVEAYDYDSYVGTPASRLINISSRAVVGTGNQSLVAGFYVIGSTSQTLLIRAVGPGLAGNAAYGGLTLVKPTLTLYDASGNVIATNVGWGNAVVPGNSTVAAGIQPATTAIMNSVYASTIAPGSNDCAMVVTLPTGGGAAGYTAQVSSADTTTGLALVEVYNVP